MARRMKRSLSLLLALVMCLSLVNISAFAAGGWEDQVVSNGQEVTTSDGKVIQSKTIQQTGTDTFDITLQVKTLEEIQEQTVSQDAAVVLILDVSNSMKNYVEGGMKINQAKTAAQDFVDALVKDAGEGSRMVSVVEFGSNAKTVLGWTEANGNVNAVKDGISQVTIGFDYPSGGCTIEGSHTHSEVQRQETTVTVTPDQFYYYGGGFMGWGAGWYCPECEDRVSSNGRHNRPSESHECTTYEWVEVDVEYDGPHDQKTAYDNGGTNIEGGLRLANNLLSDSAVSNIENTYVVLLTDGVPTYHVDDDDETNSTTFMAGSQGGSDHATHDDYHDIYCTRSYKGHSGGDNIPQQIKNKGAKLYTVAYDMTGNNNGTVNGTSAKNWMTAFSTQMISADSDIFEGLGQVAEIIVNQAKAWILTDPMGAFIDYVPDENSGVFVGTTEQLAESDAVLKFNTDTQTLTWDLKSDTTHRTKQGAYWVYTFTYSIKLDTADQNFVEGQDYPTNGKTTLTYMLTDENGQLQPDLHETEMVVPVVEGKVPVVNYTINYLYKDRTSGEYVNGKTETDSAKLWSTIEIDSGDYNRANYTFTNGSVGVQTLTQDDMVFNLYYDPIPVTVVVNHYVSTISQTDDGDVYSVPTLTDTDSYNEGYYQGDKFTNEQFLNSETYTLVNQVQASDGNTYATDNYTNVTLNQKQTVINLYYTTQGEDQRTPVDYEIHYFYREDSWQLNDDGRYEVVTGEYAEDTSKKVEAQGYHGTQVTANDQSNNGEYTLDAERTPSMSMLLDKNGNNVLNVYYYKNASDTPDAQSATLTIEHKYYEETINGLVEVVEANWTEEDNTTVYVGETWAANPDTKDGYTLKTLAEDFTVTITEASKHYEIVVEYYKDVREPVDVIINHYYTTYTWTVNPETGEGEYVAELTDQLEGVHATGTWYVGQTYEPTQIPNGYTYVSGGEARELVSGENVFNLYYEVYDGSEANEADVTVNHIYETYTSYVDADGNVVLNELSSITESEGTYYGIIGESFTAQTKEKDDFDYYKADTDDLTVTLKGQGGQYNIYYKKTVNNLGDPYSVTVQPIYKTYTSYVNADGNVVMNELTATEKGTPVTLGETFYAGQKVTALAADYGKEGFTYASGDEQNTPNLTVTVSDSGENVITIVYSKTDNQLGLPVVVLVNNVYTTVTKYVENGEVKESVQTVASSNKAYGGYYIGQYFDTTDKGTQWDGYVLDESKTQPADSIKIEADETQVTFYWINEVDLTNPTTVKVVHHYTIHDANPNVEDRVWTVGENDEPLTGYYVGQYFLAQYDFQDGIFDETHVTEVIPADAATTPGIILQASGNVVHIYYVKNVDTRVASSVKVIHNYYKDDEALAAGTTEGTYEETITEINGATVMEADSYTATLRLENGGLPYSFHSANPEGYTVIVDKDAEKNVITISYVRAETAYTVIHEYYTDGNRTGSTTSQNTGKVGDVVNAADIAKVTTYEGNTYTYTSADKESMTLTAVAEDNVITLRYDRTTGGGYIPPTPTPDPDPDPTDPVDPPTDPTDPPTEIEDEDPPLSDLPEETIDDEDPPLSDLPEETIDDEEPPMADAPETGDNLWLWITTASLSGLGLIALGVNQITTGRKKKDAESK